MRLNQMATEGAINTYHWESRVQSITAYDPAALTRKLNEFYPGHFVVGTQVFQDENCWVALVYFKVRA